MHSLRLRDLVVTLVLKLLIKLVDFLTILITPNLMGQPPYLEEA